MYWSPFKSFQRTCLNPASLASCCSSGGSTRRSTGGPPDSVSLLYHSNMVHQPLGTMSSRTARSSRALSGLC